MGVAMCVRCDKFVDLDYNVDDMVWDRHSNPICRECLTEEEADKFEELDIDSDNDGVIIK